ncbi:hypothetical protein M378DRAFT_814890 [Amanita muscaria Koide BX008]|uniref:Uncharacterized protein n=1 Tax=Amanita muscaria (strain Koide BX008) TaxID=946122 RepID=A0A0C2WCQ3_AMAMK|nr:hypothetical protein M378DRAFT_814890 [Amanita muscaria Koide BX008]
MDTLSCQQSEIGGICGVDRSIERELSIKSGRTGVSTTTGKSSRESRAISVAVTRISETLHCTGWGAEDPQPRSSSHSQTPQLPSPYTPQPPSPYTPQPPTPYVPQATLPIPQVSTIHSSRSSNTNPQTPSQSHTQSATPKSFKSRSRKASAAASAQLPSPHRCRLLRNPNMLFRNLPKIKRNSLDGAVRLYPYPSPRCPRSIFHSACLTLRRLLRSPNTRLVPLT